MGDLGVGRLGGEDPAQPAGPELGSERAFLDLEAGQSGDVGPARAEPDAFDGLELALRIPSGEAALVEPEGEIVLPGGELHSAAAAAFPVLADFARAPPDRL